jgi:PhnB protein
MTTVKAIPDGYHSITPYLVVKGAAAALDFYKRAFGAKEILRFDMENGAVGHAEITIGDSRVMLADEMPGMPDVVIYPPLSRGGSTVGMNLYVENVDSEFAKAVAAGATVKRPLQNQFYGDRSGTVEDPFGHIWTLSSHVEDVSMAELKKRLAAMPKG